MGAIDGIMGRHDLRTQTLITEDEIGRGLENSHRLSRRNFDI
jgi:hypothetical protein